MGDKKPRKIMLENRQCIGDVTAATAAIRDLHKAHPDKFLTDYRGTAEELFEHHPYVRPFDGEDYDVVKLRYPAIHSSNKNSLHFTQAFHGPLGEDLGVDIPATAGHGRIFLGHYEKKWMSQVAETVGSDIPYWIIVAGGKNDFTAKVWEIERFQQVVDHFQGKIAFVQVCKDNHDHDSLRGVIDFRGKTNVRQLVRLVHHAQGVLCGVTSLMHLAAAVPTRQDRPPKRPCVVVAGGREPVTWEAYPYHQFLHTVGALDCCAAGGCWKSKVLEREGKSHCKYPTEVSNGIHIPKCLDMISSGDVIRAIETYLERGNQYDYLTDAQCEDVRPHLSK